MSKLGQLQQQISVKESQLDAGRHQVTAAYWQVGHSLRARLSAPSTLLTSFCAGACIGMLSNGPRVFTRASMTHAQEVIGKIFHYGQRMAGGLFFSFIVSKLSQLHAEDGDTLDAGAEAESLL